MELHVLTDTFALNYIIDEYVSFIWTERYTSAGDVQFVTIPTKAAIESLTPGTFLGIPDSQEVMMIETQIIENGLLKISGQSLLIILNQRYVWYPDYASTESEIPPIDYTSKSTQAGERPGRFISDVVYQFAIRIFSFPDKKDAHELDAEAERIPNLSLGAIDGSGDANTELIAPLGPIYDAIKPIAEGYNVGMSLYRESINSFALKFKTYQGKDRTSSQSTNRRMRLSQSNDEISDVKELRSNATELNSVYVWGLGLRRYGYNANGVFTQFPPSAPGLGRRVLIIHPAVTPEFFVQNGLGQFRTKVSELETAKTFLSRYKKIHIVDAQMLALVNYKFGVDYGLGDIIEYESAITGELSKARVTEYIRSHDSSGEKAYPTIVIE